MPKILLGTLNTDEAASPTLAALDSAGLIDVAACWSEATGAPLLPTFDGTSRVDRIYVFEELIGALSCVRHSSPLWRSFGCPCSVPFAS